MKTRKATNNLVQQWYLDEAPPAPWNKSSEVDKPDDAMEKAGLAAPAAVPVHQPAATALATVPQQNPLWQSCLKAMATTTTLKRAVADRFAHFLAAKKISMLGCEVLLPGAAERIDAAVDCCFLNQEPQAAPIEEEEDAGADQSPMSSAGGGAGTAEDSPMSSVDSSNLPQGGKPFTGGGMAGGGAAPPPAESSILSSISSTGITSGQAASRMLAQERGVPITSLCSQQLNELTILVSATACGLVRISKIALSSSN